MQRFFLENLNSRKDSLIESRSSSHINLKEIRDKYSFFKSKSIVKRKKEEEKIRKRKNDREFELLLLSKA